MKSISIVCAFLAGASALNVTLKASYPKMDCSPTCTYGTSGPCQGMGMGDDNCYPALTDDPTAFDRCGNGLMYCPDAAVAQYPAGYDISGNGHNAFETQRNLEWCAPGCAEGTTGTCQHPNQDDDMCFERQTDQMGNSVCPTGTIECGE